MPIAMVESVPIPKRGRAAEWESEMPKPFSPLMAGLTYLNEDGSLNHSIMEEVARNTAVRLSLPRHLLPLGDCLSSAPVVPFAEAYAEQIKRAEDVAAIMQDAYRARVAAGETHEYESAVVPDPALAVKRLAA